MKTRRSTPRFSSKNISLFFAALMLMISVGAAAQKPNDPPGNPNPPGQEEHTQLQATVDQMTIDLEQIKADMELLLAASNAGGSGGGGWDKKLDSTNGSAEIGAEGCNSDRFKCIFPTTAFPAGEAVLDEHTGLVWDRSPFDTRGGTDPRAGDLRIRFVSREACMNRVIGGQYGNRLPSAPEAASLFWLNEGVNTYLPPGHPFLDLRGSGGGLQIWTATNNSVGQPFMADFQNDDVEVVTVTTPLKRWCVRGGHNDSNQ